MVSRLTRTHRNAEAERAIARAFERRVRLSRLAIFGERIWEALLWPVVVVLGFVVVSLFQLWSYMPPLLHRALLGGFAVAFLLALIALLRLRWPSREEAVRRLERRGGIKHRPASSYEDDLATFAAPEAAAVWAAHRRRLAELVKRLRPSWPEPRNDRRDPYAIRAALFLLLFVGLIVAGPDSGSRLLQAFTAAPSEAHGLVHLDAWVTPPVYTDVAPIVLADGSEAVGPGTEISRALSVPERSQLVVRTHAPAGESVEVTIKPDAASGATAIKPTTGKDGLTEFNLPLTADGIVHVDVAGGTAASWRFKLVKDHPPTISLVGHPTTTPRSALRLSFKASDDYGVASASAHFALADPKQAGDLVQGTNKSSAPLFGPPVMNLPLDRPNAEHISGHATQDLTAHPWAGLKVRMTLIAKDQAGQTGESPPYVFVLPERHFTKPLAKAVIEQRKLLVRDPGDTGPVARAINALTLGGPNVIHDQRVYLGLRDVYWRLQDDSSRQAVRSDVDELWQIALRIEEGDLPDAERAVQDAQEKLQKALKSGASPQQIQKLVQNLRQALAKYLQALTKQAQTQKGTPPSSQQQQQQNGQHSVSQQSLDKMLDDIQKLAQAGSTEMAQKMLAQLKDMLERLQAAKPNNGIRQQQMQRAMSDLNKLINQQQQLLDQTFKANRKNAGGQQQQGFQVSPPGRPMDFGMPGMSFPQLYGMPPPEQGQQGQQGQMQQGQQPGRMQPGRQGQQGGGQRSSQNQLGQQQQALMDKLQKLIDSMRINGGDAPSQLNDAGKSMGDAKQSIRSNNLDNATQQQGMALDSMRQGAQSMAKQMQEAQNGQNSGGERRDPMGRPLPNSGPDLGLSVKVPDRIDIQRARQVLDELRKRLSDPSRPMIELDYLERLINSY
jgi:uncharacterized protein (TIGR02302 family)